MADLQLGSENGKRYKKLKQSKKCDQSREANK